MGDFLRRHIIVNFNEDGDAGDSGVWGAIQNLVVVFVGLFFESFGLAEPHHSVIEFVIWDV